MRRRQSRDIDDIVTVRAVDRDRVEGQTRLREVTDDNDGITARRYRREAHETSVDDEFFDVVEQRNPLAITRDHDFRIGPTHVETSEECFCSRVYREHVGDLRAVDVHRIGNGVGTAIDDIHAVPDVPDDRVIANVGTDHIVSAVPHEPLVGSRSRQRFGRCRAANEACENVGLGTCDRLLLIANSELEEFDVGEFIHKHTVDEGDIDRARLGDRKDRVDERFAGVIEDDRIDPGAAIDEIVARSADDDVVAGQREDHVIASQRIDDIGAIGAHERIVGTSRGDGDNRGGNRRRGGRPHDFGHAFRIAEATHDAQAKAVDGKVGRDHQCAARHRVAERVGDGRPIADTWGLLEFPGEGEPIDSIRRQAVHIGDGAEIDDQGVADIDAGKPLVGLDDRDGQLARRHIVHQRRIEEHPIVDKLEDFDVADQIGAVFDPSASTAATATASRRRVGDRDEAVAVDIGATDACICSLDRVVRPDVSEYGDVDVVGVVGRPFGIHTLAVAVENFAHGLELAGVDDTGAHELGNTLAIPCRNSSAGYEFHQTIDGEDFITGGSVGIVALSHADAHVQPCIAIDVVVAEIAANGVAAGTTQNDLAATIGVGFEHDIGPDARVGDVQHLAQARDAIDTILRQRVDEALTGKELGGAGQGVIIVPAREAFDRVEAVPQNERRPGIERPDSEIGVGCILVTLVDRPVEPIHAIATLDARALHHDVVAVLGVVIGVVALTVHDVVTDDR